MTLPAIKARLAPDACSRCRRKLATDEICEEAETVEHTHGRESPEYARFDGLCWSAFGSCCEPYDADADLAWCVGEIERLQAEIERRMEGFAALHRNRDRLAAENQALRTHFGTAAEVERLTAMLPSPAVLEALGMAHECLVEAIDDGDVVVAEDVAIDDAGEWLARMVDRG